MYVVKTHKEVSSQREVRILAFARGRVQGVGFRPFAFALAAELGLAGHVVNSSQGAEVEIEGPEKAVNEFLERLARELPAPGHVDGLETLTLPVTGVKRFEIRPSKVAGNPTATILPDIATCPECLRELFDPADRRYRYPFVNCTHCGPRYTIISKLPYDRPNTSMAGFPMCPDCRHEFEDPGDRRYHAQPIACPACGPQVEAWNPRGIVLARRNDAIRMAVDCLRHGEIVAVLGIGGFHLMVDARDEHAVLQLRTRKRREAKPLAVMCPDIDWAERLACLSPQERRLLSSPEAPIVLAGTKGELAPNVSNDLGTVGLMLPYSPLHHLLMADLGFPVVATSGNLSEEPICAIPREALVRFAGIADLMLVHDRPVLRSIDDSVARVMSGRAVLFRRARGFAPLPLPLPGATRGVLAVGAHFKNSIAISLDGAALVGRHVGDLDNPETRRRMEAEMHDLSELYELKYTAVAHDLHPDYASTQIAERSGLPMIGVQHHVAHAAACLGENGIDGPALAVSWDGTGYGPDGTIWGGEFLLLNGREARRIGRIRPFPLPGGDAAARQGRRSALGLLFEAFGEFAPWFWRAFDDDERRLLQTMLATGRCVRTSSAGRLFDAFAALGAGIVRSRFEGDAAMRFEAMGNPGAEPYPFEVRSVGSLLELDWEPALRAMLDDRDPATVSSRFHAGLAAAIVKMAARVGGDFRSVCLTGGCFQNKLLIESAIAGLEKTGYTVFVDQRVPPNDGGIAYGQLCAASMKLRLLDADGNAFVRGLRCA